MKNVKNTLVFFIFTLVFVLVIACSGTGTDEGGDIVGGNGGNTGNSSSVSVYVAAVCGGEDEGFACYWKDGVRTILPLPVGARPADLIGLAVYGGSVYASGGYHTGNWSAGTGKSTSCYWKDGVRTDIPDTEGAKNEAWGIAVSGGSVYVSGSYRSDNTDVPCYWKDGIRTDLPVPEGAEGSSSEIVVTGGSVYVAGYTYTGNYDAVPCYWKDGVRTDLPVPEERHDDFQKLGITVYGGSVYVSGSYWHGPFMFQNLPCYWKDGVRIDLPIPENLYYHNNGNIIDLTHGGALAIAVSGGSVYVAGSYAASASYDSIPCYWKNGERTDLSVPEGTKGEAHGLAVSGGSVYISGIYSDGSEFKYCYWKDGERFDLPSSQSKYSGWSKIVVVEN